MTPPRPEAPLTLLGLRGIPTDLGPTVVTIGVFDGVHRGHRVLLDRVAEEAAAREVTPGAITFDRHPMEILRPDSRPPMLTTLRQRIDLLGAAGMRFVLVLPFRRRLSRMPAEEFAVKVLLEAVSARAIVVGDNFRFGHGAAGSPELLERLARPRGVEVIPMSLDGEDGQPISSTRIRAALAAGDVATATRLLGRPFSVEGHVVRGDDRARRLLGVPTANLRLPARLALPARGIYPGHLQIAGSGAQLPAVSNVGVNPQFGGVPLRVETHVLDWDGDLYDRRVRVSFEHRLRDETTFPDIPALIAAIHEDIRQTRRLLGVPGG